MPAQRSATDTAGRLLAIQAGHRGFERPEAENGQLHALGGRATPTHRPGPLYAAVHGDTVAGVSKRSVDDRVVALRAVSGIPDF